MVHRVAVLDRDLCQPRKCGLECIVYCPVNKTGGECIVQGEESKAVISEDLCTGCGICIKVCPFEAITILNIAEELKEDKVHQYGVNTFRLFRLPSLKKGSVTGLIGKNGIGKSTALSILAGNLKPNLGSFEEPPDWPDILEAFHGTELKSHFEKMAKNELSVSMKPQAVYLIPKVWSGDVSSLLRKTDQRGKADEVADTLGLRTSLDKKISELSGGELQRLAIVAAVSRESDFYLFDEPFSYNDVYQRLAVAEAIRNLAAEGKTVLVVEHDLALLDYVSDYVNILFGEPGTYGVVSNTLSARAGVNVFLDGYLPNENVRFRNEPVTFEMTAPQEVVAETSSVATYAALEKRYDSFKLNTQSGTFNRGEIIGILGANAVGKTTFMKMIAGLEAPDSGRVSTSAKISYKPQYLSSELDTNVQSFLVGISAEKMASGLIHSQIVVPLALPRLFERNLSELSGGELQKVAITACLLRDAEVYALDEPSAFMDVEDRIILARALQRFVRSEGRSALIIDHDIQLIDIVSDSLLIFEGEPGIHGTVSSPLAKEDGMNWFLSRLGITYRRDIQSGRPRVNKPGSKLDREQKRNSTYYYLARTTASGIENTG